ncbi:MAG: Eco57I restriction-modification methylase domain-containing protein, partial [Cyclobacteriaceae bacterium]
MIAIKNDLKIFQDRDGKRLKEYVLEVVNDELVITDDDGELFEYSINNKESQRLQETLFHEKQTIIENCLFGVDINPNSVKICRLRLWIELLKNAYYKNETELETLPNIDINIKCGNSLISRFDLDADIHEALKKSKWSIDSYRIAVDAYRNAQSKDEKHEMERLINDIKSDFRSEISKGDPKLKKLYKFSGELANLTTQTGLFEMSKKEKTVWNKKVEKLTKDTKKLETEIEEIKNNKIYENAFEWRFEFPEVLNDEGDFVGFDTVIGNPPYIRVQELEHDQIDFYKNNFAVAFKRVDISILFFERAYLVLSESGYCSYITSNQFISSEYGRNCRDFLKDSFNPIEIIDYQDLPVFDDALTYVSVFTMSKVKISSFTIFRVTSINDAKSNHFGPEISIKVSNLNSDNWSLKPQNETDLLQKLDLYDALEKY